MLALQIHISYSDQYQAEPVPLHPEIIINMIMQRYSWLTVQFYQAQSQMIPKSFFLTFYRLKFYIEGLIILKLFKKHNNKTF